MQAIVETLFDAAYLSTVITLGILMIRRSKGNVQYTLFGWMAVVLGAGDSFHLIPRALALCEQVGIIASGKGSPSKPEYFIKNHLREELPEGREHEEDADALSDPAAHAHPPSPLSYAARAAK